MKTYWIRCKHFVTICVCFAAALLCSIWMFWRLSVYCVDLWNNVNITSSSRQNMIVFLCACGCKYINNLTKRLYLERTNFHIMHSWGSSNDWKKSKMPFNFNIVRIFIQNLKDTLYKRITETLFYIYETIYEQWNQKYK